MWNHVSIVGFAFFCKILTLCYRKMYFSSRYQNVQLENPLCVPKHVVNRQTANSKPIPPRTPLICPVY